MPLRILGKLNFSHLCQTPALKFKLTFISIAYKMRRYPFVDSGIFLLKRIKKPSVEPRSIEDYQAGPSKQRAVCSDSWAFRHFLYSNSLKHWIYIHFRTSYKIIFTFLLTNSLVEPHLKSIKLDPFYKTSPIFYSSFVHLILT